MTIKISRLLSICLLTCGLFIAGASAQAKIECATSSYVSENASPAGGGGSVIISEAYGGSEAGGAFNADFIELYNPSPVPVNISDHSVQYYTAGQINGGAPTSTAHIPDATIMAPFSYYVIRVSPDNRAGSPLPCTALDASASFAETGIDAFGGKLVLTSTGADLPDCNSALNVLDRVGYGVTPFECNETQNANAPTAFTSVQRRESLADSNFNLIDFYSGAGPTPCAGFNPPSAAAVNVGGRAVTSNGDPIAGAVVRMVDGEGIIREARTSRTGNFNFEDVQVGTTIVLSIRSKLFTFAEPTRLYSLDEELTTVSFIGN